MISSITHVGFADESYWNKGRFRSLALVSTSVGLCSILEVEIRCFLDRAGVREFKWKNLDGARERFAADKLCEYAIKRALLGDLRVDVMVWDICDSRHKIHKRDDIANLARMYYHLFRNVLRKRWPDNAVWRLHPDEHSAIEWATIQNCLDNACTTINVDRSLLTNDEMHIWVRQEFGIAEIKPVSSEAHPLLQLADLFAGMAVFSRDKYYEYERWLKAKSNQIPLLAESEVSSDLSRSSMERFQVLERFDRFCKQRRLGVSLKSNQGLWTPDPKNPINFWLYEPQHPEDKAPRKGEL